MGFTFYTTVWPKGHVLHKQLLHYGIIGSRILSLRYYILLIEGRGGGGGGGAKLYSLCPVLCGPA